MNRKLRNSLTALTTCSLAFVLALVGTSPLIRATDSQSTAPAMLPYPVSGEATGARRHMTPEQAAQPTTRRPRDNRKPLVMPYFSFAPRG
ncbi:hypothetical protein [Marilutibacter alkalisoli]|uniref:Uncharacterized protein n=1 Tax=Marilutibacter alkalisoli TaxID=2591633 RepID=A0A514BRC3_9GAMM|nr:hypothetical protein [Lysobacter alkalisoli]QDH69943.1 hypothetical protein FKV23_07430 [Lysobacter alkalisoli]